MPQNRSSLTAAARFLRGLSLMATLAGLVFFGSQKAAAQKKEDKDDPKKELIVAVEEDFKKLKLGALPKGWGGDFSAIDDGKGIRCLACDKQTEFHYLKLPKMNLKGDIVIECEFILFVYGGHNQHLGINLETARGEKITLVVTGWGSVDLHQLQPRQTAGFQPNQKTRVRFAREDGIFSVQVNGKDVTGGKIADPEGPFVAVQVGFHAGTAGGVGTAKLYSVKIASEGKLVVPAPPKKGDDGEEKVKAKAKDAEIDEDFRKAKVGGLPAGWTSGASKVGAQPAGERKRLELVNQGIGIDYAELPAIELKKDFFVECSFLMFDKKTSVLLHISDGKQQVMNVVTNGEGQIFAQATKGAAKYDVSKTLKLQGVENMLRLERKDDEYILKLNGALVAAFPTNVVRGPFNMVRLGLGVADKSHRSPAITRIRVRALDNIEN